VLEALLGRGVAVDRDQRAGGAEPVGDAPRVAAGAERRVDRHVPRAWREKLERLVSQDGDVRRGHLSQHRQDAR
jgi:hypothetical protein